MFVLILLQLSIAAFTISPNLASVCLVAHRSGIRRGSLGCGAWGGGWAQGHHRCKVPLRCLSVLQSQGNQASCGGAPRARPASQAGAQSLLCPALILRRGHTPHLVTEEADRSIRPSIPSGRAHDTPDSALLGVIKSS